MNNNTTKQLPHGEFIGEGATITNTSNEALAGVTDQKVFSSDSENEDYEAEDNNQHTPINNNNNYDSNDEVHSDDEVRSDGSDFDYEEEEEAPLPKEGEELNNDDIMKLLSSNKLGNDDIDTDDDKTSKATQSGYFGSECVVKEGEDLELEEKPNLNKDKMRDGEEELKRNDPKRHTEKHGKDKKAQSRAGVVAKFGYLDEDDEEFKMDGDEVLFASLSKEKISLILRLRRALYNCGVEKEKWNNYQWQFDLKPNPNGKNLGLRLGMLVLCNECNTSFNVFEGRGIGKRWVEGHIRVCGVDKCNCGCGYTRATLQAVLDKKGSRNKAGNHFKHQDIKTDYTTMTEEVYYNGGKEKLEDERRGDKKISGDTRKAIYENIYWTRGTNDRWQQWLYDVSTGNTKVSRGQFDRLKKMEISLPNKKDAVFD